MQLSIHICSDSCNAQRVHPRPSMEADIIGCCGGSLDARGFRAAPLNNFHCNSSDLLLWHRLFLIIWSGISFSFCHSEGPLVLLSLSCSIYACCLFSSSLHLFTFIHPCLFATLALCKITESRPYKQPHMQIIHSKRNIINVKLLTWTLVNRQTRITVETWLWGGCWMFCFRWLCWLEMACTSKPSESGSSVYLQSFFSFHPQVWSNMLTS